MSDLQPILPPPPPPAPARRGPKIVAVGLIAGLSLATVTLAVTTSVQHGKAADARAATADVKDQKAKVDKALAAEKTTVADQANQLGTCAYVNEVLDYYWLIQQEIMDASTASDDGEYNAAIEGWTNARDYQTKANDLMTEAGFDGDLQGLQDECGYLDDLGGA